MKGYDVIIRAGLATWTVFYFAVSVQDAYHKAEEDHPQAEVMAVTSHMVLQ